MMPTHRDGQGLGRQSIRCQPASTLTGSASLKHPGKGFSNSDPIGLVGPGGLERVEARHVLQARGEPLSGLCSLVPLVGDERPVRDPPSRRAPATAVPSAPGHTNVAHVGLSISSVTVGSKATRIVGPDLYELGSSRPPRQHQRWAFHQSDRFAFSVEPSGGTTFIDGFACPYHCLIG